MSKIYYAQSLDLPQGFRMRGYDEKDVLELVKDPKQLVRVADVLNNYCHQKGGLVNGRYDLTCMVEELKFAPVTKKVKKDDGTILDEWDETEKAFIERFVAAVAAGEFKWDGVVATGADAKAKTESVWAAIQTRLANRCGDVDEKGDDCFDKEGKLLPGKVPFAYRLDITRAEPKARKPKGPSKDAVDGATSIINGGPDRIAAWKAKFAKGYVDPNGINITPVEFEPFDTIAPKNAKVEDVELVRQTNIKNLALAIDSKEAQVRAFWASKRKAEFN